MREISPKEFDKSAFKLTTNMLVTAEKDGKANTMTAGWGGLGDIWNKDAAFIFIRPQRYTREFLDDADTFSLTFFSPDFNPQMKYLGTVSGRDEDKITKAGLTLEHIDGTPTFKEAEITIICKKLYKQQLESHCFEDPDFDAKWYPQKDYHYMYIGEDTKLLVK